LRWLTPTVEVDLCGHATLASAHVLWETRRLSREQSANFYTRSGKLTATYENQKIALDFPSITTEPCTPPNGLLSALGVTAEFVGFNKMDYLVEVADENAVVVTGRPTKTTGVDFVSRFFAPGSGVNEDPVTGSAHCALTPYWAKKLGKSTMRGFQASARGGLVDVVNNGDRVKLIGQAVTVLRAELMPAMVG
jgi:predicted PhzF superfamily epimerase YddE/YHI9